MASITKKVIRGKVYYYARECQRVNGKPKIVWQKYLGRVEDIVAAVVRPATPAPMPVGGGEGWTVELGGVAALYDLCRRLDLQGASTATCPSVRGTYRWAPISWWRRSIGASSPAARPASAEWFEATALRRLVTIKPSQLSSQRFWDNMDRVNEEAIRAIEAELTSRAVREFDLDLRRLLFDATNFFTFIDTFNERPRLAQRGKSKEGRAALRIVGVALLVTADFHVPLLHTTYAGNQHDASTFASLTDELVARCRLLAQEVEHVTLVFDKGNNSQEQPRRGGPCAVPLRRLAGAKSASRLWSAITRDRLVPLAEEGLPGYGRCGSPSRSSESLALCWWSSTSSSSSPSHVRCCGRSPSGNGSSASWRSASKSQRKRPPRARKPSVRSVRAKVEGWLKAQHMRQLFEVDVAERDGLPDLSYRFNEAAWKQLQDTTLGTTLLFTDNDDWSDAEIVRAYRAQSHIEAAFRDMQDTHHIALRPQHHWTDQKIRVHVLTCVLALMLSSLLQRELHRHGLDYSVGRMLELLAAIKEIIIASPPPHEGGDPSLHVVLSRMSPEQRRLFEVLQLNHYTNVA